MGDDQVGAGDLLPLEDIVLRKFVIGIVVRSIRTAAQGGTGAEMQFNVVAQIQGSRAVGARRHEDPPTARAGAGIDRPLQRLGVIVGVVAHRAIRGDRKDAGRVSCFLRRHILT